VVPVGVWVGGGWGAAQSLLEWISLGRGGLCVCVCVSIYICVHVCVCVCVC